MRQPPRSHMPGFMCPSRPPNLQTGSEGHGLWFFRRRRGRQIGKQGKDHTASPSGLSHNCFAAWPADMVDKNACCERGPSLRGQRTDHGGSVAPLSRVRNGAVSLAPVGMLTLKRTVSSPWPQTLHAPQIKVELGPLCSRAPRNAVSLP